MAVAVRGSSPVAHVPVILGRRRKLKVASLIDEMIPPHRDKVMSCGTGVEALVLAILDGDHALYKVGSRLEKRGMLPLRQAGLERASLNDYRLGQILDPLLAANLNRVFALWPSTPWRSTVSRRLGCIRIRPPCRSMGPLQEGRLTARGRLQSPTRLSRPVRPLAIARIDVLIASRWCAVWG